MIGLTHTILRWRRLVVLGCAAFFLLALLGIPFIQAQSDRTQYLRRGSEVFAAVQFVDRNLAGTNQLDILIEGGQEGTFKEPAVLAKVERLSEFLRAQPEISKVISINDYLKEMNKSFNQGGPEYYVLPPTRESIAQFLLIYSMSGRKNELEKYVDAPYSRTRVSVRTPEHNTAPLEALTGRIQAYLSDHFPAPLEARVASLVPPINSVVHYLVNGMLWSLAASVLMVGAIVCLGFRSLYPGLVCMIPNLTPIVACLGLMGWCGIWLDVATAMTFSIALGLTVDDTVHFMSVYRMELERTRDEGQALRLTLEAVGPAMVEAGIIIVCGFLILVFASLRMNAIFGLLCAFIMFMALLTDLLITPLCMIVLKPFRFAQPAPGRPAAAAPPVTPLLDT